MVMKWKRTVEWLLGVMSGLVALRFLLWIFVCDTFLVNGVSMEPTLRTGQRVLVDKVRFGARIYTKFDFDTTFLSCFRTPGLGRIKVGDVVAFNYPLGHDRYRIEFKINYVYLKRCLGCPGDTVEIRGGRVLNRRVPAYVFSPERQDVLAQMEADSLPGFSRLIFPYTEADQWTVKEFGPFWIPKKGGKVPINRRTAEMYRVLIEYETGALPAVDSQGHVSICDKIVETYTFTHDYYFMMGDNVLASHDSRYFGPVPDDYVIGISVFTP